MRPTDEIPVIFADAIQSLNYDGPDGGEVFADAGTLLDLATGSITSTGLVVDGTTGDVSIRGDVEATSFDVLDSLGNVIASMTENYYGTGDAALYFPQAPGSPILGDSWAYIGTDQTTGDPDTSIAVRQQSNRDGLGNTRGRADVSLSTPGGNQAFAVLGGQHVSPGSGTLFGYVSASATSAGSLVTARANSIDIDATTAGVTIDAADDIILTATDDIILTAGGTVTVESVTITGGAVAGVSTLNGNGITRIEPCEPIDREADISTTRTAGTWYTLTLSASVGGVSLTGARGVFVNITVVSAAGPGALEVRKFGGSTTGSWSNYDAGMIPMGNQGFVGIDGSRRFQYRATTNNITRIIFDVYAVVF